MMLFNSNQLNSIVFAMCGYDLKEQAVKEIKQLDVDEAIQNFPVFLNMRIQWSTDNLNLARRISSPTTTKKNLLQKKDSMITKAIWRIKRCLPMVRETEIQSQIASNQRL